MPQIRAIIWAQWRSLWSYRSDSGHAGRILAAVIALAWYGLWASFALAAVSLLSNASLAEIHQFLPWGLTFVVLYWQLAPIVTAASLGASLDLKKLLIYPITEGQLFAIEVLLRLTTGFEMILVLTGVGIGLALNPAVPVWGPLLVLPLFALFNLFLAAGVRNLLERLLAYKHVREGVVFLIVLAVALPQLLAVLGPPRFLRQLFTNAPASFWLWTAVGRTAAGEFTIGGFAVISLWIAGAYVFGRAQFRRGLLLDKAAAGATSNRRESRGGITGFFYEWPALFFRDPLASLVEKELRSLSRSPRFRLIFLMGFSFGMLIWYPLLGGREGVSENYPIFVSGYAVLLLSDVLCWNIFGFDRSAVQLYFMAPVPFGTVLLAKNLAAGVVAVLEITIVLVVCVILPFPAAPAIIVETYAVVLTLTLYMLAAGNLTSVRQPRAASPEQTWGRASSTKLQITTLLLYPILSAPVLLAYAARYAFDSQVAFYGVLAVSAGVGVIVYWVARESAIEDIESRKEAFLKALGEAAGPVMAR